VTFSSDDNRFYATMSTGGQRYLVEGDFAARTVRTLARDVERPSLSPDLTRIAFKAAIDGDPHKGLAAVGARPGHHGGDTDRPRLEALTTSRCGRPTTIAYALQRSDGVNDIWSVDLGGGRPRLLVPQANSPAVIM
jgi:hypothetical protein